VAYPKNYGGKADNAMKKGSHIGDGMKAAGKMSYKGAGAKVGESRLNRGGDMKFRGSRKK